MAPAWIRVVRLGAATGGAEITGCLMGGGATAGDAVGAGGAFTGFGAARALGGAIADFEVPAAARQSVLSVLPLPSGPTVGLGASRQVPSGPPERAKRLAVASTSTLGRPQAERGVSGRRMGISTLVSRFSRVIEAGAGGDEHGLG